MRWCPWMNILLPAPLAPACWPGWQQPICTFPSSVGSIRSWKLGVWCQVSPPPLRRRDPISPWRGEPIGRRQCPQRRAVASGSWKDCLDGLVPFVICTIDQKMGLLNLESRARGFDLFHIWTGGKSDPLELPVILLSPHSFPYAAHSSPLSWLEALSGERVMWPYLAFGHRPWPLLIARVSLTDPLLKFPPLIRFIPNHKFRQWYH